MGAFESSAEKREGELPACSAVLGTSAFLCPSTSMRMIILTPHSEPTPPQPLFPVSVFVLGRIGAFYRECGTQALRKNMAAATTARNSRLHDFVRRLRRPQPRLP